MSRKTKVLIIDDSLVFRRTLAGELAEDSVIEVVGTAEDAFSARDKILKYEPDVLTLDVEMPRLNGIEFLKKLMPQYPLPTVVISGHPDNVFDALQAGAVDFVAKPVADTARSHEAFIKEVILKVKIASTAKVGQEREVLTHGAFPAAMPVPATSGKVIAIGASTGGAGAIGEVLRHLPPDMPGIVAVLHMPAGFTRTYAERMNGLCRMEVKEAEDGDRVIPGRVLLAPGDFHMKVCKKGQGYAVRCFKEEKVNGHRPSVDVLFHSVAKEVGRNAIGVILTGMGHDGADGLLQMREKGALTIGQDKFSCVVYGMPKAAYEIGAVHKQASLREIPRLVHAML